MNISIETIPHDCQRYPTAGDWEVHDVEYNPGSKEIETYTEYIINISETGNEDMNFLLALHEMIEVYLCHKAGITGEIVDKWDKEHPEVDDPGSIEGCPYIEQHIFAESLEYLMARKLSVDWKLYEKVIQDLFKEEL